MSVSTAVSAALCQGLIAVFLRLQLDKLVYMVDERLPVTLEEDEDEDMEEGSTDAGSGSDDDEVWASDE